MGECTHRSMNFNLGPGRFTPREEVSHTRRVKAWNVTQNRSGLSKEENRLYPLSSITGLSVP
jgi:hypothetical protein